MSERFALTHDIRAKPCDAVASMILVCVTRATGRAGLARPHTPRAAAHPS